ncbi:hypothetical protein WK34_14760 [Burkholderia vietnamiensis]|nr:hypothetical protein WK34_14760 [Burkholderia vietnamiensis]
MSERSFWPLLLSSSMATLSPGFFVQTSVSDTNGDAVCDGFDRDVTWGVGQVEFECGSREEVELSPLAVIWCVRHDGFDNELPPPAVGYEVWLDTMSNLLSTRSSSLLSATAR